MYHSLVNTPIMYLTFRITTNTCRSSSRAKHRIFPFFCMPLWIVPQVKQFIGARIRLPHDMPLEALNWEMVITLLLLLSNVLSRSFVELSLTRRGHAALGNFLLFNSPINFSCSPKKMCPGSPVFSPANGRCSSGVESWSKSSWSSKILFAAWTKYGVDL